MSVVVKGNTGNDPEHLASQLGEAYEHLMLAVPPLREALKVVEIGNRALASQLSLVKQLAELRDQLAKQRALNEAERRILARCAQEGVAHLTLTSSPHGSTRVRVGTDDVELPPELAVLLQILADEAESDDALVGWKTNEHIRAELKARLGKAHEISPHGLEVKVSHLRRLFREAGINPELVMTEPGIGRRFALRRARIDAAGS